MPILLYGSGEFGLPTFERLRARQEVAAVVTQPDRPAGRKRKLTPTPVAQWAEAAGLPVIKSENVNTDAFAAQLRELRAEAAVVIAFGQKLSEPVIEASGQLVVNLHASLLPRHRGASPINAAILAGDRETGVSVISLAQRMDAGRVYAKVRTEIDPLETAGELHDRLAALGPDAVERVLDNFAADRLEGELQDESQATRAPKLSKADGWVDFDDEADAVRRRVHGLTPWPGVRVIWKGGTSGEEQPLILKRVEAEPGVQHNQAPGTILKGHRVAAGGGAVRLLEVQAPGTRAMGIDEFTRGHSLAPGDVLLGGRPG